MARIHCESGSESNVLGVVGGKLDIGVAQSAVLYQASKGLGHWEQYGRLRNLRSICTLFTKSLTIVARDQAKFQTLTEINGKSISIGEAGTGTNSNSKQLLAWLKQTTGKEPRLILELSLEESLTEFREGRLDAICSNLSHPAPYLKEIFKSDKGANFVRIGAIREFIKQYPSYSIDTLAPELYPQAPNGQNLEVIATPTILFTHQGAGTVRIKELTSRFIKYLPELRQLIPEMAATRESSLFADSILPAHPGAIDAFFDAGMIRVKPQQASSSLMAISYEREDPMASRLAAQLCARVNEKRLPETRLVMLSADNERESIYRIIADVAQLGFSSSAELYQAWNGVGFWRTISPMQNLAVIARVYDIVLFELIPPGNREIEESGKLPLLLPQKVPGSRDEALLAFARSVKGEEAEVKGLPAAEARALFQAGKASLLLAFELSPEEDKQAPNPYPAQLTALLAEHSLQGNLRALPLNTRLQQAHPWFSDITVKLNGKPVTTSSLPVLLFGSLQTPGNRLVPALDTLLPQPANGSLEEINLRLQFLAQNPPIPFHPVIDLFLPELAKKWTGLASITPTPLPPAKIHAITITSAQNNSGGLYSAGMLSYILSQPGNLTRFMITCTPALSEATVLQEVDEARCLMGIVPATLLHEATHGEGAWKGHPLENIQVIGSLYTTPLAFYASPALTEKKDNLKAAPGTEVDAPLSLRHFVGKRVSAPEVTVRRTVRGKSITIFNPMRFREALLNRTMINTEEGGLSEAIQMYNQRMIDGFFVVAMHPFSAMADSIAPDRAGFFVPISEGYDFVISQPYYVNTSLPAALLSYYPLRTPIKNEIPTIGVPMMLIGHSSIPQEQVRDILTIINNSREAISETHPFFKDFSIFSLLNGISITRVHKGAIDFFQSEGLIATPGSLDEHTILNLGTGTPEGSFLILGNYLERVINARMKILEANYRVATETSDGSHENIVAVSNKAYDLGISQADLLEQAYYQPGVVHDKPLSSLRAICNLTDIPLLLVVRNSLGIRQLSELKGKSINIGAVGSGTRAAVDPIINLPGLALKTDLTLQEDPDSVALDKLYSGGIDGLFIAIGHSAVFQKLLDPQSGFTLLPLDTPEIQNASAAEPYLLAKKSFPGLPGDIMTIATRATLMTNESVSAEIVEMILTAILKGRQQISPMPAGLQELPDSRLAEGLTIPLHPGAEAAFRKALVPIPAISPPASSLSTREEDKP